jgi:hypothetical protein
MSNNFAIANVMGLEKPNANMQGTAIWPCHASPCMHAAFPLPTSYVMLPFDKAMETPCRFHAETLLAIVSMIDKL